MGSYNDFVKRLMVEKDGFAEVYTSAQLVQEIETYMIGRNITRAELAELTGISQRTISKIFNLTMSPTLKTIAQITSALQVKLTIEIESLK